jgi:hypothetical protein
LESNTPSSAEWGTQVNPNVPVAANGAPDLPDDEEY